MRLHRYLRHLFLFCIVFVVSVADAASPKQRFLRLAAEADGAQRAARWGDALARWRDAHEIAPEATDPLYGCAASASRLQRIDEAFRWLDLTLESGFVDVERLLVDSDLENVRKDSRWSALVARARSSRDEASLRAFARSPRSDAPSFRSYDRIAKAFDRRALEIQEEEWRLSQAGRVGLWKALLEERIAADDRYVREHPGAKDAVEAAWDGVRQRTMDLGPYNLASEWGPAGKAVVEELNRFIEAHPKSTHEADAHILRAFAEYHIKSVNTPEDPRVNANALQRLDASLGRVERDFAGTTSGGMALVWRLVVGSVASPDTITPEMRRIHAELAPYANDRKVQALLQDVGRPALLRLEGLGHFDATDLAGVRWSRESFIGKVTLVEFWATWCRPCVLHLPVLRTAWEGFRSRGFQIVGVNVDEGSLEEVKSWLASNRADWPQVWDGKGWESPLVKRLKVRGIPLSVLIDQRGNVAGVDLPDDALLVRIEALLQTNELSGRNAPDGANQ